MAKRYLECGKIVSTHGIRGEVKVEVWCDSPEVICDLKHLYFEEGKVALSVKSARPHKNMALLLLDGYSTIDEANTLRGKTLYLNREDIPDDGRPFLQDILGLRVLDVDTNQDYGTIQDIIVTGANDVYLLKDEAGKERLVPVIDSVVLSRDLEEGWVKIRPLEGLFEE